MDIERIRKRLPSWWREPDSTPKTDGFRKKMKCGFEVDAGDEVIYDFARELERENNRLRMEWLLADAAAAKEVNERVFLHASLLAELEEAKAKIPKLGLEPLPEGAYAYRRSKKKAGIGLTS